MNTILTEFTTIPVILALVVSILLIIVTILTVKKTQSKRIIELIGLAVSICAMLSFLLLGNTFFLFILIMVSSVCILLQKLSIIKEEKIKAKEEEEKENLEEEPVIDEKEVALEAQKNADNRLFEISSEFVIQAAKSFSEESGIKNLLEYVTNSIVTETKSDGGTILLIDDFDDIISVKAFTGSFPPPYQLPKDIPHKLVRVETNFRFAQFNLKENIFGLIATSGKAELITEPLNDERFFQNEPEDFLKLGSYIFVPLKIKDSVIGIIALARKIESPVFTEEDFRIASILTGFASTAIKTVFSFQEIVDHAELTREAELACKIQTRMHVKLLPAIPGLSLGHSFTTTEGVCGDYFDIIPSRKDRISFVLADVAGKGMNSLLIMVMLRAILRLVVNTTQTAATIVSWANRGISIENSIDHFASMSLINYDSTTNKIQFATAGTTPIYIYRKATHEFEKLSESSEPIGVEKSTEYADKATDVNSGDILITYTDGLVEAINTNGKQYTSEKLLKLIANNSSLSGKEIANIVKTDVNSFCGSTHQHDDQTILVIKIQ